MIIAHDLTLLLRSTARIGSTCVPKQTHDSAGKRVDDENSGAVRPHRESAKRLKGYV